MPPQTQPPHDQFRQQLADIEARLAGVEHQQQMVITDPTGASGDPAHGHAVVVIGSLKAICGISAFGIASFKTGAWIQL
jgi:hypothetical protein